MELYERILTKEEINKRFHTAVNAILMNNLISSKAGLAESLGMTPSKLSEILNGRMNASAETLARMCDFYEISPEWLFLSRGNKVFRTTAKPKIWIDDEDLILQYSDLNNEVKTETDKSHVAAQPSTSSIQTAKHVENPQKGIPLIPFSAMAGALKGEVSVLEYECEHYVVPAFRNADFLIPVSGDSMIPTYKSGDIVACQRIPMSSLFFQWNRPYVLDTEQGAIIKRIKPGSDEQHIRIISDNPDYDAFELPLTEIYSVGLVIGIIRLE